MMNLLEIEKTRYATLYKSMLGMIPEFPVGASKTLDREADDDGCELSTSNCLSTDPLYSAGKLVESSSCNFRKVSKAKDTLPLASDGVTTKTVLASQGLSARCCTKAGKRANSEAIV